MRDGLTLLILLKNQRRNYLRLLVLTVLLMRLIMLMGLLLVDCLLQLLALAGSDDAFFRCSFVLALLEVGRLLLDQGELKRRERSWKTLHGWHGNDRLVLRVLHFVKS